MALHNFGQYAEHRNRAEMQRLLHHGHWIPVLRGYTAAHLDEHFPGRSWNEMHDLCTAAGIVAQAPPGAPLSCDPRVRSFHFTDVTSFAVEWVDGTVTTDASAARSAATPQPRITAGLG